MSTYASRNYTTGIVMTRILWAKIPQLYFHEFLAPNDLLNLTSVFKYLQIENSELLGLRQDFD